MEKSAIKLYECGCINTFSMQMGKSALKMYDCTMYDFHNSTDTLKF